MSNATPDHPTPLGTTERHPAPRRRIDEFADVMSARDVAEFLGVDVSRFYGALRTGVIPLDPLPIGGRLKFSRHEVARMIGDPLAMPDRDGRGP